MVNTRRSESSGLAPENGPRCRTRRSNDNVRELGSSCESDSGGQGEEDESIEDTCENKTLEKSPSSPLVPRVRELRNRFVCEKRKFTTRRSHDHITVNDRRHNLAVYSSHKMHDDLDSEEDCYSPRFHSRKNHYSKSHIGRIERRTALSLRPITRKFYKDASPATCNSEESDFHNKKYHIAELRRSLRTRNRDKNMSWLTTDQMPKVGYPNFRERRYTDDEDDDSREAPAQSKKHKGKYIFTYDNEDIHGIHPDMCNEESMDVQQDRSPDKKVRNQSRAELHDKENKEENVNGRANGRIRRSKDSEQINSESNKIETKQETPEEDGEDNEVNGENDEGEEVDEEEEEDQKSDESSGTDAAIKPVTRSTRLRQLKSSNFSQLQKRNRKITESSSSSETGRRPYSLRNRPSKPIASSLRSRPTRQRNLQRESIHPRRRFNRSSSTSSSADSDRDRRKSNKYINSKTPHTKNELTSGAGIDQIMPIEPETLDRHITFNSVGGLDSHIQCLKEMILLPMMYPEVFKRFQITPPRGVLFHGPPGTGKTLIARALANECSFGSKKVSFFMRKGADLLNKWVGESEKQLRLLFKQAAELKPSIIFFDELDGLAPVRSSRQDQIHASIVSTLLALMDGIDNRGEVIVIGATNRIDAIDPALRRPGRFDRELFFPLPAQKEREEILKVHVTNWATPPTEQLISYLAENAIGYCGSDLRALCSEAVIQSFRRTYPQVYNVDYRLLLDPQNVKVEKIDFLRAKSMLTPASHRISQSIGRKLPVVLEPLLRVPMKAALSLLERSFPHGVNSNLAKVKLSAAVRPAQLLILGDGHVHGHTTYLAPALLHQMEHIHAHTLDLATLHGEGGRSPEEACLQVFHEAKRNVPSIIYIPNIDLLWTLVNETLLAILIAQITQISPNNPILILATADKLYEQLPQQISEIFSKYRNEVIEVKEPSVECRQNFFRPLIVDACMRPPRLSKRNVKTPPPLPRAPTPPPKPMSKEEAIKIFEQEERTLRELRIFLRDMCKKLASNKLFFMFTKPVDIEEVPDYTTIIKEPMDLETMMTKVDFHRYECARDFLNDIELIVQNALEYNPARTSADKQIRHRACALRDYAFALIKNEMDSDFEEKCQKISYTRKERNPTAPVDQSLPQYIDTPASVKEQTVTSKPATATKTNNTTPRGNAYRKRKIPSWQRGYVVRKRKKRDRNVLTESQGEDQNEDKLSSGEESKENHPESIELSNNVSKMEDEGEEEEIVEKSENCLNVTAPLTVNCDTTTSSYTKMENSLNMQSPHSKRRLSDLLSPSELLDDPLDFDDIDQALNEEASKNASNKSRIDISQEELETVLQKTVTLTVGESLQALLDLHYQLNRIIKKYLRSDSRKALPKEIQTELMRFVKERNSKHS